MKIIRLYWNEYEYQFDDIKVSDDLSKEVIQESINLALATHENEVENFIFILKAKGFFAEIVKENIELYDFNSPSNNEFEELNIDEVEKIIKNLSK